jgi:hypothetical protein
LGFRLKSKSKIQNPKSKIQNFLGSMSQSLTRNNFSDILLDPTTIAVVGSIAVHAIFAANLAFFTQPSKELNKPDPGTVKVVELTPRELQRIPQAPKPVTVPIPSQQVLPPVYQPSTPAPPINQPITPPITPPPVATFPNTIPLSPNGFTSPPPKVATKSPVIRTPPKPKVVSKPPAGKQDQKAVPQSQPEPPTFDDPEIGFKPTPEPTPTPDKSQDKPKIATKPSPPPTPTPPKKKTTATNKPPKTQREIDSENQDDREPSKPSKSSKPSKPSDPDETGLIIPVPAPGTKTASTPTGSPSPSPQPTDTPAGGDENGVGTYGKYAGKANDRLQEYQKLYPGILERSGKPSALTIPYPVGTVCSKSPQKPFIVLMIVFGKVTDRDPVLGSETTGDLTGKQFVAYDKDTPENKKLGEIAVARALEAANTADQNRDKKNKDKELLYQYRVTFDPTTCKKP